MLLVVVAIGLAFLAVERMRPARSLARVAGFSRRAVLLNATQVAAVVLGGITWDRWLARESLLDLRAHLHPILAGAIAYVVSTFVYYWWHRLRHQVPILWRLFHQVHHSPSRIEVVTAFYKHPAEQIANALISSAIAYPLLGLSPAGGAVYTLLSAIAEFFYHANIRTPGWVGLFVQRPEMHRIHHERGAHAKNYGDLPLWDRLFGTLHNPARAECECGFETERELRFAEMIAFRDVHASPSDKNAVRRLGLWGLLVFGCWGAVASALEPLGGKSAGVAAKLAKLTLASPAPKVFCQMGDEEPFALVHVATLEGDGVASRIDIDRHRYARFDAPYAYRNVYGAVLAFAPLLRDETVQAVLTHGFCSQRAPLLTMAGVTDRPDAVTIATAPAHGALGTPRVVRIQCTRHF